MGASTPTSAAYGRIARLREAMAAQEMAAFYVRDVSNIRWLTGFDGVFDGEAAHALYVDANRVVLHTDSRYATACETAAAALGGTVQVDARKTTHMDFAADLWYESRAERGERERFGIEDGISLAEYRKLTNAFGEKLQQLVQAEAGEAPSAPPASDALDAPDATLYPLRLRETSGLVLGLREVKDADEVARMRAAQAITDAAFAYIAGFMRPGMTEREVQLELEGFMLRSGAEGLAFSSIVATGANGANPHAIPGETRLEAGQCVVMDFGARARGYCSDMTRMVFLGEPDTRLREAYAVLRRANEEVQAMLRPGVTGKEAHELAERILDEGGFGGRMGHGLGHGVGLDIHEEPVLAPRNERALEVGNVVTVEPGIYLPGDFGMRLEDFGIITETGFDRFTRSTHDMVVV